MVTVNSRRMTMSNQDIEDLDVEALQSVIKATNCETVEELLEVDTEMDTLVMGCPLCKGTGIRPEGYVQPGVSRNKAEQILNFMKKSLGVPENACPKCEGKKIVPTPKGKKYNNTNAFVEQK